MARKSGNLRSGGTTAAAAVTAPSWWQGLPEQKGPLYWLVLAVCAFALLGVVYPEVVFQGQAFVSSDASNSYGFSMVGDRSLAAGHYPLWNPYLFAGMPSFGSLAYPKFVYPPAIVFQFLQTHCGLPPLTWLLGHLLWGALGMMWLLSRWKLPTACLLLGAVIFLLFPKVVAWGVHGHGSKLAAAMYLPWIVGWALRVQSSLTWGQQSRAVAWLGLLMGLQFLRGHVQITYYTLATVGWLSLWNAVSPFAAEMRQLKVAVRARGFGLVVLGLGIGGLIGAVLLVPVHEYAGLSIRGQDVAGGGGVGLDYATGWSFSPQELGTLVMPAAVGYGKATYMGGMPFTDYPNYLGFLLLVLVAAAWRRERRSWLLTWLVFAALTILASFGGRFYTLLYDYLPFFNKFRVPSMILILPAFGVALLAPRGLADLVDGRQVWGRAGVLPAVLAAIGLFGLAGGGLGLAESGYVSHLQSVAATSGKQAAPVLLDQAWLLHKASLLRIGWICLVAALAVWYAQRQPQFRRRGLAWVLLVLVFVDLSTVNRGIIHPEGYLQTVARNGRGGASLVPAQKLVQDFVPVEKIGSGPAAAAISALAGHDRVWPWGRLGGQNQWMADGIRSLGGYHPAKLAAYEQIRQRVYGQRPAGALAAWLAGRAVVFEGVLQPEDVSALQQVGLDLDPKPVNSGLPAVYRNRAALPRARLVTKWQPNSTLPGAGALLPFLDGVASGAVDVRDTVYLDDKPVPLPQPAADALPLPVFVTDDLDEVVLTVDTPVPSLLLLADMMTPGWQVEVDGGSRPLLTADLVLRAVALEAGTHTVRFHFVDPSVRKGLTLTIIGAILVGLLLVGPFIAMKSRRTGQAAVAAANEE